MSRCGCRFIDWNDVRSDVTSDIWFDDLAGDQVLLTD
jgi:hypothetical protein